MPKKPKVPALPDKRYFRIGEVSKIAGLPSHTLRYWETEFKNLAPQKAQTGQRIYKRDDVEFVLLIKKLLHEQKFTIEGARHYLKQNKNATYLDAPTDPKPGAKAKPDTQLGFGFGEIKLKDKLKKTIDELKKIEKSLRIE